MSLFCENKIILGCLLETLPKFSKVVKYSIHSVGGIEFARSKSMNHMLAFDSHGKFRLRWREISLYHRHHHQT